MNQRKPNKLNQDKTANLFSCDRCGTYCKVDDYEIDPKERICSKCKSELMANPNCWYHQIKDLCALFSTGYGFSLVYGFNLTKQANPIESDCFTIVEN